MSTAVAVGSYDYTTKSGFKVIVGGGTAGLVLASRLTEIPSISVAVLEAGQDRSTDLRVLAPGLLTSLYGNPDYDWIYTTVPQTHLNNRVIGHPRGKQLGGSSAINYLAWTHASRRNVDDWGRLGNEGWSWDVLEPYFAKVENFTAPAEAVVQDLDLEVLDLDLHGTHGPVANGFPREGQYTVLDEAWPRSYEGLGIGVKEDPTDGVALGGYTILTNADEGSNTRSYAANTYLKAATARKNLKIFTDALVAKIEFDTHGRVPVATGVHFSINGTAHSIQANHEVILSAGSFGSPQILELSGIGSKQVLSTASVPPVHENPNVGENLQDHPYMPLGFEVNPGIPTLDDLANETIFNAAFDEYLADATGPLATVALGGALLSLAQILPNATEYASLTSNLSKLNSKISHPGLAAQYRLTLSNLLNPSEAAIQHMNTASGMNPELANDTTQLFFAPTPGNYFTILGVLEHPFSRGTVHITSSDPAVHPEIDPHYLEHPADVAILSKIALHVQNALAVTPPLSDHLVGNGTVLQPVYRHLTEDNVESEIRRLMQSEYHPVGTCAMLPRRAGGVVDERFRVHGVRGLRVVDASVIPMLPRGNLQTLVYALAERAADFIRADLAKPDHGKKRPW
ncbi:hypothetical protein LTR95_009489 [Oleoguttula sp. CCFEE 5521]